MHFDALLWERSHAGILVRFGLIFAELLNQLLWHTNYGVVFPFLSYLVFHDLNMAPSHEKPAHSL